MAVVTNEGNKEWFEYICDNGDIYLALLDSDIGLGCGFAPLTEPNISKPIICKSSKRLKMRMVNVEGPAPLRSPFRFPVGSIAGLTDIQESVSFLVGGAAYKPKSTTGEHRYFPKPQPVATPAPTP